MSWLVRALLAGLPLISPVWAVDHPTLAPAIVLANVYRPQIDVSDYLVSEKLDGMRAIWDGQTLRFRSGRLIAAPTWFIAGLPKQALDGELWLGRGRFEQLSAIVRDAAPDDDAWREVRYMIFEMPGAAGSFAERAGQIERLVQATDTPWLQAVAQSRISRPSQLQAHLEQIVQAGGEGLMLHQATAEYRTGRSDVLLKMKPQFDAEAEVVAHQPGQGKYLGQLGALRVRTPQGREFLLGSGFSDQIRRAPPSIGSRVTYRYRDLTASGLPRFASFLRTCED